MDNSIINRDDMIDSRDVIARIEELQAWLDAIPNDDPALSIKLGSPDAQELASLKALAAQCEPYATDWQYGEQLIRRSYFVEYVKDLAIDCGYIPKDLPQWIVIDWLLTAHNVEVDYTTVDFDGVEYLIRCV